MRCDQGGDRRIWLVLLVCPCICSYTALRMDTPTPGGFSSIWPDCLDLVPALATGLDGTLARIHYLQPHQWYPCINYLPRMLNIISYMLLPPPDTDLSPGLCRLSTIFLVLEGGMAPASRYHRSWQSPSWAGLIKFPQCYKDGPLVPDSLTHHHVSPPSSPYPP